MKLSITHNTANYLILITLIIGIGRLINCIFFDEKCRDRASLNRATAPPNMNGIKNSILIVLNIIIILLLLRK